jgi:uncharacterized protein YndB with AHSA1/START domain
MGKEKNTITIEITVEQPFEIAWKLWTEPRHITQWNFALDTWHCPKAKSDLKSGGRFSYRMEARDGSFGFDFSGRFIEVVEGKLLTFVLDDNRTVSVQFIDLGDRTRIVETFEAEGINPPEKQREGWQAILQNFKKYAETFIP